MQYIQTDIQREKETDGAGGRGRGRGGGRESLHAIHIPYIHSIYGMPYIFHIYIPIWSIYGICMAIYGMPYIFHIYIPYTLSLHEFMYIPYIHIERVFHIWNVYMFHI